MCSAIRGARRHGRCQSVTMVTAFIRAGHMTFGFTSHNASRSKLLLERSWEITFQALHTLYTPVKLTQSPNNR